MLKSTVTAEFDKDIVTVWNVVTNLRDCSWRSDISRITVLSDPNSFIEYTKKGFPTKFDITVKEAYERYEFDIENKNFSGHWTGCFHGLPGDRTQVEFTEEILDVKNPVMRVIAKYFMNLKKMQMTYIEDLRDRLRTL
ncbi:MAG: polyketide cyclase [Blautia sp.]